MSAMLPWPARGITSVDCDTALVSLGLHERGWQELPLLSIDHGFASSVHVLVSL